MEPVLSIVIPVRNEEESIPYLAGEIDAALLEAQFEWECLWVDDGSTDNTPEVLRKLASSHPRHSYIRLAYHRGQSTGMVVGFRAARGNIIATMDGDGQNDPADIPRMMKMVIEGEADVVIGYRQKRHDSIVRKISSRIANGFRNWITGEKIKDVGCGLRVFRSACVEHICAFEGMHRFFPTMVRMNGYGVKECPVNHRPRSKGKTKYGIHNRLWVGLMDSFGVRWLLFRRIHYRIAEASAETNQIKVQTKGHQS